MHYSASGVTGLGLQRIRALCHSICNAFPSAQCELDASLNVLLLISNVSLSRVQFVRLWSKRCVAGGTVRTKMKHRWCSGNRPKELFWGNFFLLLCGFCVCLVSNVLLLFFCSCSRAPASHGPVQTFSEISIGSGATDWNTWTSFTCLSQELPALSMMGVPLLIVRQIGYSLWDVFYFIFFLSRQTRFLNCFSPHFGFWYFGTFTVFTPRTPRSHIWSVYGLFKTLVFCGLLQSCHIQNTQWETHWTPWHKLSQKRVARLHGCMDKCSEFETSAVCYDGCLLYCSFLFLPFLQTFFFFLFFKKNYMEMCVIGLVFWMLGVEY